MYLVLRWLRLFIAMMSLMRSVYISIVQSPRFHSLLNNPVSPVN